MGNVDLTNRNAEPDQPDPTRPLEADSSLGQLLSRLTTDFGNLVATQVELAKVEIKEEVTEAGKGAGLLTAGGFAGYLAITLLSFAAAWGLDEVMPTGLAFLLVGVVWIAIAGVLYASGRNQLQSVRVAPNTKAAIKEDMEWAKQQRS